MTMTSVQSIRKGGIIIERVNGKKRMTPVTKVEFNACSMKGSVHVNRNACYEPTAMVDFVSGDETLGDMEREMTGLGDLLDDFPTDDDLRQAGIDALEAWADRLVKQ